MRQAESPLQDPKGCGGERRGGWRGDIQGTGNRHRVGGCVGTGAWVRSGEGWQAASRSMRVLPEEAWGIAGALVVSCPWTEEGGGEQAAS